MRKNKHILKNQFGMSMKKQEDENEINEEMIRKINLRKI